ncbi:MAG: GDP-fucose synthetase [Flavobacterium sp.]|nr:GDP-fucose synthetase [Flavobacterium sp.]
MYLKNKKILVTGGAGFIGQHLVNNLIQKRNVPKENIFVPLFKNYDLRKWENCQKVVDDQDIVIHLAAVTGDVEFHKLHPGRIFYDNIIMGVQLMEAARMAGVEKFVGIGSVTAYPEAAPTPFQEDHFWSGYPAKIHAPYSLAKKMLLVQGQAYLEEYGFNAIHLLLTSVYGPGTNPQSGYIISSIIKKIVEAKKEGRKFIEVWGTGKPIRDFLYVEDAAEAIILATEKYDKSEPVNIGSGRKISTKDLVHLICKLMDFRGEIRWDKTKPDSQLIRTIDVSRAKKEFNLVAFIPLEVGLKKTIEWHLAYDKKNF